MIIHPNDNVEVVLQEQNGIPAGHKVAIADIPQGADVVKYGFPIGHATCNISKGEHVHSHNLSTNLVGTIDYQDYQPTLDPAKETAHPTAIPTFMGYKRDDGRVGIRNEIWILPTVGCVADLASRLATAISLETSLTVKAFPHTFGCSQLGSDHESTRQILASLAMHPNAGGVLVLGLGCENNQLDQLKPLINSNRVRYLSTQEVEDEEQEALILLRQLIKLAEMDTRSPQPISSLSIGLKCGGSDGFSGLTANPLLGRYSDYLVHQGGNSLLTEVPEMFGAETILMRRCSSLDVFKQTVHLINDFKEYYLSQGLPVGENPSPGNKAGGITTLEEKSLGCVQKGGTSPVNDVLSYGQQIRCQGLSLLQAPGNDLVASTALAAAGCQIVLFTTGRGTPFGTCVPTVKVSTNTALSLRKPHWIDFNAGTLLEGEDPAAQLQRFQEYLLQVIEGRPTHNENYGYSSIAIWKNGVTL